MDKKPKTPAVTTRKATTRRKEEQPAVLPPEPAVADNGGDRIIARPDGYHWVAPDGKQEFGPFDTMEDALADMVAAVDDEQGAPVPGETLQEAERDIGIADWIDPDTGEPAEGQSPPHLEEQ